MPIIVAYSRENSNLLPNGNDAFEWGWTTKKTAFKRKKTAIRRGIMFSQIWF